jgi:hypothetical protein
MGLEEYGVRLEPGQHRVTYRTLLADLADLGYTRLPSSSHVSGAILAEPPTDEFFLTEESREYIIEAMLKTEGDTEFVRYLSLRFAVCQPMSVMARFREVVHKIAEKHGMQISDGTQKFGVNSKELHRKMNDEVLAKRQRWHQIFDKDSEETKIAPDKAWQYFLNKQQNHHKAPELAHR